MFKIGITGSIGTGKTTIASMFAKFNIPILDADDEIKKILTRSVVKRKLKEVWPFVIIKNKIDRGKLKSIIFCNKTEKKKLENLLYPYLNKEIKKFENKNKNENILVYDVPLIYETKSEKKYDLILLANCNENLQKKRVLNRDKISNSLFESIKKSQLSFNEKIKFEPKIINTDNSKLYILIKIVLLIIEIYIKLKIKKWNKKEN